MPADLAALAPKLSKLVLLLSSDKPGEVTAAPAAIDRALKAADASWHDLARQLTEPQAIVIEREAPPRHRRRAAVPDAGTMLAGLRDHPELNFCDSVYRQFGRRRRLSDNQLDVLARIWRKVEDRGT